MTDNRSSLSFGRYLKAVRLEKGIALEAISSETKIGVDYLLLIEKEDHQRLPAEVFVKGFIRAYAQEVGADGEEAVKRYAASRRVYQDAAGFDAELKRSGRAFWPRLTLFLGVLLGIVLLSVFILSDHNRKPANEERPKAIVKKEAHEVPGEPLVPETKKEPAEAVLEKLLLKIDAVEDTWIKIIIDGHQPKEYSLKPGDLLKLEATSEYNLLIGNAAGVVLTLNGDPVKISGKSGQIINVKIP